jgi:BASS family bile acid:Na+ symporter
MSRATVAGVAERVPDALPGLAILAAAAAIAAPSGVIAGSVDALLAGLVLVTALDIDPTQLRAVAARWRAVLGLSIAPLIVLALLAKVIATVVGGAIGTGVLAVGLSPTEVASVGLIGLMGGPVELALGVLAGSLVVSALLGPPALGLLASHAAHVDVPSLLGRFAAVVIVPLIAGVVVRSRVRRARIIAPALPAAGSLLVVALVYGSLSGTGTGGLVGAAAASAAFLAVSAMVALLARPHLPGNELVLAVAMRDFAVAAALASAAGGAAAARVAGVYGVLMLLLGAGVTGAIRRRARAGLDGTA